MIASTETDDDGLAEYLSEIGAHAVTGPDEVDLWETDAVTGAEELVEVAGRSCYRSFRPELNPNLSRVREGNETYLGNILKVGHGSVLEHASVTFAFYGVSRVFTHELVRHRAGTAFSQESLRYVRLEELVAWYPTSFGEDVLGDLYDALAKRGKIMPGDLAGKAAWVRHRAGELRRIFVETFEGLEKTQRRISNMLYLDELEGEFQIKKQITSAMRRLAPIGLGTAIICTANHRSWRHMIRMRTAVGAEEEMRLVFGSVAKQLAEKFPALYQDMLVNGSEVIFSTET